MHYIIVVIYHSEFAKGTRRTKKRTAVNLDTNILYLFENVTLPARFSFTTFVLLDL
jgi:hypothetical protein